jgi:large subunit ribosomal protein L9
MQIILLDKVVNLGNLGEIVKVKDGYARNFLIPSGRARRATAAKASSKPARRTGKSRCRQAGRSAQAQGEKLAGTTIKLTQKAGVDGRLFGSVTNHDIAEELNKQGYKVAKAQVRMPNGPIKVVGESAVSVALHTDVVVESTCRSTAKRPDRTRSPKSKAALGRLFLGCPGCPQASPR